MSCPIRGFTVDRNKSAVRFPFVGIDALNAEAKSRVNLFYRRYKLCEGKNSKKFMIVNRLRCGETCVQQSFCQFRSHTQFLSHKTQNLPYNCRWSRYGCVEILRALGNALTRAWL